MYTFTYELGTTDWGMVQHDMGTVVKSLRSKVFDGNAFAYFWVIGVDESGRLHGHLALAVDLDREDLTGCWERGIVHGPDLDLVDSGRVGSYMAGNVRDADERPVRPKGARRYGRAHGYPVTCCLLPVRSREDGIALCVQAMDGEVPALCLDSPDGWDGPPMTFMSWPVAQSATPLNARQRRHGRAGQETASRTRRGPGASVQTAHEWLAKALAGDPVRSADIKNAAAAAGISKRTLQRARAEMSVEFVRAGFPQTTVWRLRGPSRDVCLSALSTSAGGPSTPRIDREPIAA